MSSISHTGEQAILQYAKEASNTNKKWAWAAVIIGSIIGAMLVFKGYRNVFVKHVHTVSAQGVVIKVNSAVVHLDGDSSGETYACDVDVTYECDNKQYSATVSTINGPKLQVGDTIDLLINPCNPTDVVAYHHLKDTITDGYVQLFSGFALVTVVWGLLYFSYKANFWSTTAGFALARVTCPM